MSGMHPTENQGWQRLGPVQALSGLQTEFALAQPLKGRTKRWPREEMYFDRRWKMNRVVVLLAWIAFGVSTGALNAAQPEPQQITLDKLPASVRAEVERLASPDPQLRAAAVVALGKMKDQAPLVVPLLVRMMADDSLWPSVGTEDPFGVRIGGVNVCSRATAALIDMGPLAVDELTAALSNPNARIRLGAAQVLGKIKDPRAIVPLIIALKDQDWQVEREASASLTAIDHPNRVSALIMALKDKDIRPRTTAAQILGRTKDPRVVEPLIEALKDRHPEMRRLAATGLGRAMDLRATQPLIRAMRDTNPEVQRAAADALGQIHDPSAAPALIVMLKDDDWQVRASAVRVLGRLRDPRVRDAIIPLLRDGRVEVRKATVEALSSMPAPQVTALLAGMLNDKSWEVQRAAAESLAQLKDPSVVPLLISILKSGDPKARSYAAQLLGFSNAQTALEPLREAGKDTSFEVRAEAAKALRRILVANGPIEKK